MRIIFALLFIFCTGFSLLQKNGDEVYTIEPGIGINDIKIGMSYNDFTGILGVPYEHRTYAKEKKM